METKRVIKWAGTEDSFSAYAAFLAYIDKNPEALFVSHNPFDDEDDGEEGQPEVGMDDFRFDSYLLEEVDGVAIVNIKGPMVNEDSFIVRFFGLTSYPEIVRAVTEASEAPHINAIVLNIDSPGGTVAGIDDATRAIQAARETKPVTAVTSGMMLSGGYWLAAAAGEIYGTRMSQVGSIGVITRLTSVKRMLDEDGVDVEVIRAGKKKALGSPYEEITDEARQQVQAEIDKIYDFFVDHVATSRGLSTTSREVWADGKEFFGEEAVSVGLLDAVKVPEDVIADLSVDNAGSGANNMNVNVTQHGADDMPKDKTVVFDEKSKAALASGAPLDAVEHEKLTEPETEAEERGGDVSTSGDEPETAGGDSQGQDDQEIPPAAASTADGVDAMLMLTEKVAELSTELASAKVKVEELEAKLTQAESGMKALKDVAAEAVQRLEIATYERATSIESLNTLTPTALAEKYHTVKSDFEDAFGVVRRSVENLEPVNDNAGLPPGIVPKS